MLNWKVLATTVALTALGATSVQAQVESDPVMRLNQIGRHIGRATVCEEFGFDVHKERVEALAVDAIAVGVRGGFSENLSGTYVQNAMNQAMQQAQQDIQAMSAVDQKDGARFAENIRTQARKIVSACRAAANDPMTRTIIEAPSSSDETLVREFADKVLTPAGQASWQTPYINAGADVVQAVAVCANHLTRAQSDAYVAELYAPNRFPLAIEEKAMTYFDFWKQKGRESMAELDLDATQCNRLLTTRAAALKAAR
ncbi:hypothetical protein [Caulobacter sp.]|uniref:hypothetical protein n=1 Tax=Caulobacter sp. TaxID=78 RepID=UPI001B04098F|nr:hypothetical protein [Caulobacter sp.]MBO9543011.1 hypothetical protein [Caulobacter sp.]